jgi:NTE family protein
MLFHVGALWRLNELSMLKDLTRISSVSGGSIVAGYLGMKWSDLHFDSGTNVATNFADVVVAGIRAFAGHTVDVPSILKGVAIPFLSTGQQVSRSYNKLLFHGATLQCLPDSPRFVINASNLQSGALWRFEKPYMADWKVGTINKPTTPLAVAVAASSAFPPFLSPVCLKLKQSDFISDSHCSLQHKPYTTKVRLVDGGVYDNLGLEPIFKRYMTVLVSDGGKAFAAQPRPSRSWALQTVRVLRCMDHQVGSLRSRDLIDSFKLAQSLISRGIRSEDLPTFGCARFGAYWGIGTDPSKFTVPPTLSCPFEKTQELAAIKTRLMALPDSTQERLINCGYAACDLALRTHYWHGAVPPQIPQFPYPKSGVG